jgi:hypothetical protein
MSPLNPGKPPGKGVLMAAGNFNQQLNIAANGFVEWPTGPLTILSNETILRIEVWVIQKLTGAIQMTNALQQDFNGNSMIWTADRIWFPRQPDLTWQVPGLFQAGRPALGIAVLTSSLNGVQDNFWWSEEVELI